jgi:hypothetical protein
MFGAGAVATLFGGKRKWLFGIVAVLVAGWFLWDYVDAKTDALETQIQGWQDHAANLRERYTKQREKAERALQSVQELQRRNQNLKAQKQAALRKYEEAKSASPKLREWAASPLPTFVYDRVRELAGTTPVGGRQGTGPGNRAPADGPDPAAPANPGGPTGGRSEERSPDAVD